jgi:hypothetical protein
MPDEQTPAEQRQGRQTQDRDLEWKIPPIGVSGLTGVEGTMVWGAINKFSQQSRWSIGDVDSDDEINFIPQGGAKLQTPSNGPTITTLPAAIIWKTSMILNGNVFLYALCSNGHVYQVSTAGAQVDLGGGFTITGTVDIAPWQNTLILLSDSVAQKIYSWNGTTLATVFSTQPVQFIGVFAGRLWMGFNSTIQWTNANTYNSIGGDSGSYIITDGQCANPIIGFMDLPTGLLVEGSNWFKTITNLTTSGAPPVLTFQQNTLEGNVGPINKWSVILIGSTLFFGNTAGFWEFNGAFPTQISGPWLNGFMANIDTTSNSSFSAAYGLINNTPCVFWQVRYLGDTQVQSSYTVFGYTLANQQWFRFVQGTIKWITGIVSSAITNNAPTVWGCDGTNIFQMFTNTTAAITSQYNSKLWDFRSALDYDSILAVAILFIVTGATTITVGSTDETNIVDVVSAPQTFNPLLGQLQNNAGTLGNGINNSGVQGIFQGSVQQAYYLYQSDGRGRVRAMGLNVTVFGAGTSLVGIVISYKRTMAGKGS